MNKKYYVSEKYKHILKVLTYVTSVITKIKNKKIKFEKKKKNKNFYEEKINTAKYFFDKILPRIDSHYHSAIAGSESLMKAKFN